MTLTLTVEDFERMLGQSRHNANYNIERAANYLYLHHIQAMSYLDIVAQCNASYSQVSGTILTAESKLRNAWPLYSQTDVNKLYACPSVAKRVWPNKQFAGAPETHRNRY